ncbi:MAG: [FeFe] hydrogenase H-cluster radical SAM maturase HydG [Bacteroidetes bacterium GWF2_38_335]|nr:MAG: [FeFe] hydrogenase H-cluster radical SAM maturase HydG [Bacteroidetes bacterium GWF2_38_335]OFY81188.1 MAG: [FeFe] hydrogenase H-cluster radical SAM maturase HydG [Bacteroidetes bacterium RIFOXYA12_FULL_38_20]HBS85303.1 [FeFe] hydrogenase H-cluster radical SAM maturase HydG [Bacteroidales bacterium]
MKFNPQQYRIKDEPGVPFIDPVEIQEIIDGTESSVEKVSTVIARSFAKERLSMQDVAVLINARDSVSKQLIRDSAKELKKRIYGNRIVLFAPLYVGNLCSNNCSYCGFRASNTDAVRKTLTESELIENVKALEENGQKRLILVFGEHRNYSPEFIANAVKTVYGVKSGNGEIRRVNINAAPLDEEGFRVVKEAGIGTYQVFQETYNKSSYEKFHTAGKKADFNYRLVSLDRAMVAGIDDVGIGALFGLYDWRFEVLSLIRHVNHLEACFNIGPHTISFPRLQKALEVKMDTKYLVDDDDFQQLVAILRLAVPYTGMILTARESEKVRKEVLQYGCSQIDAGTKIEIGAYAGKFRENQELNREQFYINDNRSLGDVVRELIDDGYLPSFCTACYRKGRTGEHFMEFSVPGFIKRFCTANAILTLAEYICDYADEKTAEKGWKLVEKNLEELKDFRDTDELKSRIEKIKSGQRDLYY